MFEKLKKEILFSICSKYSFYYPEKSHLAFCHDFCLLRDKSARQNREVSHKLFLPDPTVRATNI